MMVRGAGQHLITWAQTQVDGSMADPSHPLLPGSIWRWFGVPLRVDGQQAALLLGDAHGQEALKRRAAAAVVKMARTQGRLLEMPPEELDPLLDGGFAVADGRKTYLVVPVQGADPTGPLLLFPQGVPPVARDLTIVDVHNPRKTRTLGGTGVICFTPGTLLATEHGPTPVEDLFPGDRVLTKDNGPQPVLWMGLKQFSGARLFMDPSLRPIRLREGSLAQGEPQPDLVVSPDHRVLLSGPKAEALFNTPEVLVRAGDLVDDRKILVDHAATSVIYVHLLLPRHEILWANGVETESFHPASADLSQLAPAEREAMAEVVPELSQNAALYGPSARRCLSKADVALLQYEAPPHYLA